MAAFFLHHQDFFFGEALDGAVFLHGLELFQFGNGAADGLKIGEHAPQPTVIDVEHAAALGLFPDGVLGLLLGAHEEDDGAVGHRIHHVVVSGLEELHGLLQVDDVNAVSGPEDIRRHLGVPTAGLVAEMDAGLQQFLHSDISHGTSSGFSAAPPPAGPPDASRLRHQPALAGRE